VGNQPTEWPHPTSEARSKRPKAPITKCPFHYQSERTRDRCTRTVPGRRERSGLRPAPQAGTETRRFGCRGRWEERNIGGPGGAHRTDRTAVNTSDVNTSIEPPSTDRISRQARSITSCKVQRHGHDNTHPHSQA